LAQRATQSAAVAPFQLNPSGAQPIRASVSRLTDRWAHPIDYRVFVMKRGDSTMIRNEVSGFAADVALIMGAFFIRNAVVLIGLSVIGLLTFVQ
jgi:hypothetical protein